MRDSSGRLGGSSAGISTLTNALLWGGLDSNQRPTDYEFAVHSQVTASRRTDCVGSADTYSPVGWHGNFSGNFSSQSKQPFHS
jgi:hypothetical protein